MSLDYSLVVRSRKRSMAAAHKVIAAVLADCGAQLVTSEEDGEDDEADDGDDLPRRRANPRSIELQVSLNKRQGGPFLVRRLPRGFELSLVSYPSSDPSFEAMAELLQDIGHKLGTPLAEGDEQAQALLDEADEAEQAEEETQRAAQGPLSHVALISLLDAAGQPLQQGQLAVDDFFSCVEAGGLLRPGARFHPLLNEDLRFGLGGARLVVTVHTGRSEPFRKYVYDLDGYGRVRSFSVTAP